MWQRKRQARARRARCEAILRALDVPVPFDEFAFCAGIAARRNRPIRLLPLSLRRGTVQEVVYGLVISTLTGDIIVYEQDASRTHRQQIIVHEACHLVLNHRFAPLMPLDIPAIATVISGDGVLYRVAKRPSIAVEEELEAELLALLILERAAISAPSASLNGDAEAVRMLGRLAAFYRLKKAP